MKEGFRMSNPSNNRIDSASKVIKKSPQVIYQAYLNPESLIEWLPPKGMSGRVDHFEPYGNGTYQITLTYDEMLANFGKTSENTDVSSGKFLELVPDRKIVVAVIFESDDPKFAGEMIQTWYLEEVEAGTKVTIICENVPEGILKEDHDAGLKSTLDNLDIYTKK